MADRISTLPDEVICYILCFVPTKDAVATSVLSKRWNPLWRSVPTLDFDDGVYSVRSYSIENYHHFVNSVNSVILSRDLHQPIQTFRLRSGSYFCNSTNVNMWVNAVVKRSVEHLNLSLPPPIIDLPPSILSHKTLVVLKLTGLSVTSRLPVDLPSLRILHLNFVIFLERLYLAELLSGCPVLEDLEAKVVCLGNSLTVGEFKRLPKLVRACIGKLNIRLEAVNNVEFLRIVEMDVVGMNIPVFHNLTHIELSYSDYTKDWLEVVELLKHCPKLQILVIDQNYRKFFKDVKEGEEDWPYPQSVPESISLHLKTCRLNNYKGLKGEFRFARYIMQNATFLQSMTICCHLTTHREAKLEMIEKLSSCTRHSATCKLSFQ